MVSQFSNHSTLGKASLILAILTVIFFVVSIVLAISAIILVDPGISILSSIFTILLFIFSIITLIIGAVSYWVTDRDKYGLYAFIIGLVFLILTFVVQIAVAATVYVYVSGMLGPPQENITPSIFLTSSQSGNNCTLTIIEFSEENIKWSDVSYTLVDTTNAEEIDCIAPDNEVTVSYNYEYINGGKSIFIHGGANGSDELKNGKEYSFNLFYEPTNSMMYSVSWTQ